MTTIASVGTYLPPWESEGRRVSGPDEDALTMAVAAGRAADPMASALRVVFVSRSFPLLEGGNGAVLLAGLSLSPGTPVTEVLGGGPTALDLIASSPCGTLVVAADDTDSGVGAGAILLGGDGSGADIHVVSGRTGSLPTVARTGDGSRHSYEDPRLQRDVGTGATVAALELPEPMAVVGVAGTGASTLKRHFEVTDAIEQKHTAAAEAIRVVADVLAANRRGWLVAVEQSTALVAELGQSQHLADIRRDEPAPQPLPATAVATGVGIPISLPAYARAFESKLRWQAAVFPDRSGIDDAPVFPPRVRVDRRGRLADDYRLAPLPRTGTVYTHTTVRIPVPELPSPYSLALIQLDDSPVRVLLKVTGVPAGEAEVGQSGSVVLRRIAIRSGIPDYGYAFWPGRSFNLERASA